MADFETLMPIRTKGDKPAIFFVHGEPLKMAQRMQPDRPVYGLSHVYHADFSATPESIEQLAATYLSEVQQVQPRGPYHLCGFSAGGMLAFEMARQIRAQGEEVAGLTLIEPTYVSFDSTAGRVAAELERKDSIVEKIIWFVSRIPKSVYSRTLNMTKLLRARLYWLLNIPIPDDWRWLGYLKSLGPAMRDYRYKPIDCGGTVLYRNIEAEHREEYQQFWEYLLGAGGKVIYFDDANSHEEFMLDPALGRTVDIIEGRSF